MALRTGHVLLIDGNGSLAALTTKAAGRASCMLTTVSDFVPARKLVAQKQFDLILIDATAVDGDALDRFLDLDLTHQGKVVLLGRDALAQSGHGQTPAVVVHIPESTSCEALQQLMEGALRDPPSQEITAAGEFNGIVGRTPRMQALFSSIRRVAGLDVGVLVQGESGTGKELVAHALHALSGRDGKFVAVNCGAVAPELLSSQMFGHERGSFTGAIQSHAGYFEQAAGGTLFLDEITEMPLSLQVYLLRVIETHSLTRVGGSREVPVNTRIITASNRDLQRAVAAGALRQDLYFRLLEFPLMVPPLRERREDIPLLVRHFLALLNSRYRTGKRISDHVVHELSSRAWPGNVRELRHEVQRLYILASDDGQIDVPIEPARPLWRRASDAERPSLHATTDNRLDPGAVNGNGSVQFAFGMTLEDVERAVLLNTLAHCRNSKRETARVLDVSIKTIYNKLLRYRSQDLIGEEVLGDPPEDRGDAA